MDELKPCPFCGSYNIAAYWRMSLSDDPSPVVRCRSCGASVEVEERTMLSAKAAWNRRAPASMAPTGEVKT